MTPAVWVEAGDLGRLMSSPSVVALVGSYDGSRNFGDIVQLEAAIALARETGATPMPVVELEYAAVHRALRAGHPRLFRDACFLFFDDGRRADDDALVRLEATPAFDAVVVQLYGGGYLNEEWGARKLEQLGTVEGWLRERSPGQRNDPLIATGHQVSSTFLGSAEAARSLVDRAECFGVRDPVSLEAVQALCPDVQHLRMTADDAAGLLMHGPGDAPGPSGTLRVNVHLNAEQYVTDDPGALEDFVSRALEALHRRSGRELEVRMIIAYDDGRISERPLAERFAAAHRARVEEDLRARCEIRFVDVLSDLLDADLATVRAGALTICCSYHVALTSMLNEIPTLHVAASPYYRHKSEGLRRLFDLPADLFADVAESDPAVLGARAAELLSGDARTDVIARLRGGAARVLAARLGAERTVAGLISRATTAGLNERVRRATATSAEQLAALSDLRIEHHELKTANERLAAELALLRETVQTAAAEAPEAARLAEELQSTQQELRAVTSSRAWRAVRRFWRVKLLLRRRRR